MRETEDTEQIKYTIADVCTEEAIKRTILDYRKKYPTDQRDDRTLRPMAVNILLRGKRP